MNKKQLVILALICIPLGCSSETQATVENHLNSHVNVVMFDQCEYLLYEAGALDSKVASLTHKGNCKNKIHIYNKVSYKTSYEVPHN